MQNFLSLIFNVWFERRILWLLLCFWHIYIYKRKVHTETEKEWGKGWLIARECLRGQWFLFLYMNYFYIHNHEREIINIKSYTWQSKSGRLIQREYEEASCFLLLYMHFLIYITTKFYIHNNVDVMINMPVCGWQRLLYLLLLSAQILLREFCMFHLWVNQVWSWSFL